MTVAIFPNYYLPRFGTEDESQRVYLSKLFSNIHDQITQGLPPSGAAGGVLTGTYPNPGLANTTVTPGTYGDSAHVPQLTVGTDGRLTGVTNIVIAASGKSIVILKFAAVAQSTKFDSTTKLALGSEYFDPNDAKWGLSGTSTATFFMLLETTNASNLAAGDLFQQTGTGSPTTVASITPTAGTTATLVSVSVSTAFRPGANAGVFTARSWITTNNANDRATCLGAWLEITP